MRLGERFPAERGRRGEGVAVEPEHVELVLALERHVDPRLRRMEIEMPRPEAVAAVGRDRDAVRQQPVFVAEYFQGTRILWLAAGRIVAARDEDRQPVVRRDPHLVAVDPGVDRSALPYFLAQP